MFKCGHLPVQLNPEGQRSAFNWGKEVNWYSKRKNLDRDMFVTSNLPELKALDEPNILDLYYSECKGMSWNKFFRQINSKKVHSVCNLLYI